LAAFSKWTELVQLLLPRAQMDLLLFAVWDLPWCMH
jgi:hypothetical protein